jgi:hypothetical protein
MYYGKLRIGATPVNDVRFDPGEMCGTQQSQQQMCQS